MWILLVITNDMGNLSVDGINKVIRITEPMTVRQFILYAHVAFEDSELDEWVISPYGQIQKL